MAPTNDTSKATTVLATRWTALFAVAALLMGVWPTRATTVIAPSFDELVSQADTIFIGEVVERRSAWETRSDGRSIVTIVTFDVTRVLKGRVGLRTELTFLGGTIGEVTLDVPDMPKFRVGDRDVLFVSPERNAVSPLVGFSHGRFRIVRDVVTGAQQVRAHDGRPVVMGLDAGKPVTPNAQPRRPLVLDDFESLVRERVQSRQAR